MKNRRFFLFYSAGRQLAQRARLLPLLAASFSPRLKTVPGRFVEARQNKTKRTSFYEDMFNEQFI